jgi:hypothetical protein
MQNPAPPLQGFSMLDPNPELTPWALLIRACSAAMRDTRVFDYIRENWVSAFELYQC